MLVFGMPTHLSMLFSRSDVAYHPSTQKNKREKSSPGNGT